MKHRNYVDGKIALPFLLAALFVALCGTLLADRFAQQQPTAYADVQLAAAMRMHKALEVLRQAALTQGIEFTEDDINDTGLIGPEWTALTTSLGHLDAKRSSLNPDFAALLVQYFKDAGLQKGDTVAVGVSGSFPGLAIATLCAASEMELNAKVIASFGASMYGATRPELSIPKMFRWMREAGLVEYTLLATSPGGDDDHGESMLFEDARAIIARLAAEEGVEYIDLPTLEDSIARRLTLFGTDIKCFVNVGGASANSGNSSYTLAFPNGLVIDPPTVPTTANRGLMYEYAARGVPVINLLNVRGLCNDNGLPLDPSPMPLPGNGGVYHKTVYKRAYLLGALVLALALLAIGWRRSKRA